MANKDLADSIRRKGKIAIQEWREDYPGDKLDLSGVITLTETDLSGVDFRGANLSGTNLNTCNLEDCKFGATNLRQAKLIGARLSGAVFQMADLHKANFTNAKLGQVVYVPRLSLVSPDGTSHVANTQDVSRQGTGGLVARGNVLVVHQVRPAKFLDVDLRGANFQGASLFGAVFEGCLLEQTDFTQSELTGTKFIDCKMVETKFHETDLTSVHFAGGVMRWVSFKGADLYYTMFSDITELSSDAAENQFSRESRHMYLTCLKQSELPSIKEGRGEIGFTVHTPHESTSPKKTTLVNFPKHRTGSDDD